MDVGVGWVGLGTPVGRAYIIFGLVCPDLKVKPCKWNCSDYIFDQRTNLVGSLIGKLLLHTL